MTGNDPYSSQRIASGAAYLIAGKAVSAVANIVTFMLLVRGLPVEQFAAYAILFAMTELADTTTGFGISHVLARYVPELLVKHRRRSLYRLIGYGLAIRALAIASVLGIAWLLSPVFAPTIGLENWQWAIKAYLLVAFAKIISMALFSILEAMLRQKVAQIGASAVTLARCVLLALAGSGDALDLQTVIMIELGTDLAGVGIALIGVLRATRATTGVSTEADSGWLRTNRTRMLEFGLKGYLQHLLILPYSGSTSRVLVGSSLSAPEVALFGFAQGFADMMGRYLPINLLSGVIRPVLTARYVRDRRFEDVALGANLLVKVSGAIAFLIAVAIYAGGDPLLGLVTKGKYGEGLVGLLMLMCALVFMYAFRTSLDQVCHAVERNGPLIWSNIIISGSVVPGIMLLPVAGIYAMPISTLGGLFLGSLVIVWRLRATGFDFRHDFRGLSRLGGAMVLGMLAAEAFRWAGTQWGLTLVLGIASYITALVALRPASAEERHLILAILRRRQS